MKPKFKLGDKVIVQGILEKVQVTEFNRHLTKFETKSIPNIIGVYIGYRTAQTGYTIYDPQEGPLWHAQGKVGYYLVVTNERQNPIKAHPDFTL